MSEERDAQRRQKQEVAVMSSISRYPNPPP